MVPKRGKQGGAPAKIEPGSTVVSIMFLNPDQTYDCPVCLNTYSGDAALRVCALSADHVACRLCALKYVRSTLTPGITRLDCLHAMAPLPRWRRCRTPAASSTMRCTSCSAGPRAPTTRHAAAVASGTAAAASGAAGDPLEGERPLTSDEVLRYGQMCVAFAMKHGPHAGSSDGDREIRCPNPACAATFYTDTAAPSGVTCAFCGTPMCSSCGAEWLNSSHASRTCAQVAEALEREREAAELAASEIAGTFKPCPHCGMGTTHYRGHGCHHITCPRCKGHWCFTCCGNYPCSAGCPAWCKDECDCVDCPECRPGKPCTFCVAGAAATSVLLCGPCHGESPAQVAVRSAAMKVAREAKMKLGWCGPRTKAPAKAGAHASRPAVHVGVLVAVATDLRTGVTYLHPTARAALPAAVLAAKHATTALPGAAGMPAKAPTKVTAASLFAALSNTVPANAGAAAAGKRRVR